RWIVDHRGGFGLTVAVADRQAPGRANALDDLWIQRFAGAYYFTQLYGIASEFLLHEQAPHSRWSAQSCNAESNHRLKRIAGAKTRLVIYEYCRACIPWREDGTPGVFGPSRRADIPVEVTGLKTDPIHR